MNSFRRARTIETWGMNYLLPFLKEQAYEGRFVLLNKGPLARALQETIGDILLNSSPDRLWSVEVKCEAENRYGNLFLEIWSNRNLDDRNKHAELGSTIGWLCKLKADLLFYYFIDGDDLYIIKLFDLQRWAFGYQNVKPRLWDYPIKRQEKYQQLNDTWGACVPISVIEKEVGVKLVHPRQLQLEFGE